MTVMALISPRRVAGIKRVSYDTVLAAIRDGILPATPNGHGHYQVEESAARAWKPRRVGRPMGSSPLPADERHSVVVYLRLSPRELRQLQDKHGGDEKTVTVRRGLGLPDIGAGSQA